MTPSSEDSYRIIVDTMGDNSKKYAIQYICDNKLYHHYGIISLGDSYDQTGSCFSEAKPERSAYRRYDLLQYTRVEDVKKAIAEHKKAVARERLGLLAQQVIESTILSESEL